MGQISRRYLSNFVDTDAALTIGAKLSLVVALLHLKRPFEYR